MGRKPNPLIQQYFNRGPKLNDNSNRYPHTCKLCGEDFPKGRIDSLTGHITKPGKCPAISEADRIAACLQLHGIPSVPSVANRMPNNNTQATTNDVNGDVLAMAAQQWSALEALAEASRQVDINEKQHRPGSSLQLQISANETDISHMNATGLQGTENFDIQTQFLEHPSTSGGFDPSVHPPAGYDPSTGLLSSDFHNVQTGLTGHPDGSTDHTMVHGSPSQSLPQSHVPDSAISPVDHAMRPPLSPTSQALNQDPSREPPHTNASHTLLLPIKSEPNGLGSVADLAAADNGSASLQNSFLDPQLVAEQTESALHQPHQMHETQTAQEAQQVSVHIQAAAAVAIANNGTQHTMHVTDSQNWTEMTYMMGKTQPAISRDIRTPVPGHRGGVRMDTHDLGANGRPKNSRARFSSIRRKEVQEVRKLGACIRCRILRKTCGKGDPCDTCCKVLSPRVWRAGCVRTKLCEQLELYSAGVQVVLAQNRYNMIKQSCQILNSDSYIECMLFPSDANKVVLRVFDMMAAKDAPDVLLGEDQSMENHDAKSQSQDLEPRAIMIDSDTEDTPKKIEEYMRATLPLLIENEPSPLIRMILSEAFERHQDNDLLRNALELWGLVDIIDRERQWNIIEHRPIENLERWIRDSSDRAGLDIYTVMLIQLNAAAERKANNTSRTLLSKMQRILQDSKVKIGFPMFLTCLVFLNTVEKSTWAFRAWEQHSLRGGWPLERQPETFIGQGNNLADLLKLLLSCRRILPTVLRSEEAGVLGVSENALPDFAEFYKRLNVTYETVHRRQESEFDPVDSRCLELTLCGRLLLGAS